MLFLRHCLNCGTEYRQEEPLADVELMDCPTCQRHCLSRVMPLDDRLIASGSNYANGYTDQQGH